jgi:hypothetical protein
VSIEGLADGPLDDVEVMLRGWLLPDAFDRLLVRAPRLSWVHSATSGVERALTPAARERGVIVTNARGVFSRPIAEYVLMMILAVSRRLPQLLSSAERTSAAARGRRVARRPSASSTSSMGRAVGQATVIAGSSLSDDAPRWAPGDGVGDAQASRRIRVGTFARSGRRARQALELPASRTSSSPRR